MAKAHYSKPANQLDLEARQKKDYVPPARVAPAEDPGKSNNGYIATDPIYQNHADHTHAPYQADEKGAEGKLFAEQYDEDVDFDATDAPESVDGAESDDDDDGDKASATAASGGATTGPQGGQRRPPAGQQSPPGGGGS